ncbi:MAG: hypothetical protein IPJ39_04505 [Saprospiraceae bacterium]|nr:hypothetical protein [Saprospiraceae bacterium]
MNSVTTALFGNYRNGEYLQFMKNVLTIYQKFDLDALHLTSRVQALTSSTTTMNEVFMAATAHELTPELQLLGQRRDKALIGIRLYLDCMTYKRRRYCGQSSTAIASQLFLTW